LQEINWEVRDTEKLIKMYPYLSNEDLSIIFKRNVNSIQHKASRLELKKDKEVNIIIRSKGNEGRKSCSWKGGRKLTAKGYVLILRKGHPIADINGYVLEHRYIMCEYLGRILLPTEIVHHINFIKTDNRIENLKIMSNAEHTILHHTGAKRSNTARTNIINGAKNRRKRAI